MGAAVAAVRTQIIDRIYVETAFDQFCAEHHRVCNRLDPIRMRPREHRPAEPQTLAHLYRMATVSAREPVPHRPRWGGSIVEPYAPGQKPRRRKSA